MKKWLVVKMPLHLIYTASSNMKRSTEQQGIISRIGRVVVIKVFYASITLAEMYGKAATRPRIGTFKFRCFVMLSAINYLVSKLFLPPDENSIHDLPVEIKVS